MPFYKISMLIVKLKSTCKAKEDSILPLYKIVRKCLCQTVDLLLLYYMISQWWFIRLMQAFVCMMQRDWPQVHQEGDRRREVFKQLVNRPITVDNLTLPNLKLITECTIQFPILLVLGMKSENMFPLRKADLLLLSVED